MEQSEHKAPVRKASGRSRDTLFRVTFRNQIQLIGIADSKANIILSINSLIISVIIAVTSSGFFISAGWDIASPSLGIPVVLIILGCLISAVFSILAAKPKIIKPNPGEAFEGNNRKSLLFFGNIADLSLNEYLLDMEQLLGSAQAINEHLIIDLFNQSKVLKRKYNLIGYAYLAFMIGIIGSVVSFILLWIGS